MSNETPYLAKWYIDITGKVNDILILKWWDVSIIKIVFFNCVKGTQ